MHHDELRDDTDNDEQELCRWQWSLQVNQAEVYHFLRQNNGSHGQ